MRILGKTRDAHFYFYGDTMIDKIKKWKHQYGKIFKFKLEGKDVYARCLNAGEIVKYASEENITDKVASSVILNDVELKLPGSIVHLSTFIIKKSSIDDEDILVEKAILNRRKMESHFIYEIIVNICKILPYKPDELFNKSLDDLLEITAIAERITGNHIILTGDEPATIPTARPNMRESNGKFNPPEVQEMMNDSVDALSKEMAKHGKKAPTLKEKKKEKYKDLNDLQRQMKELRELL